jgi:hypothetical protein
MRLAVPHSLRTLRLLVAAALIGCGGDSGTNPVDDHPASVVAASVVTQSVTVDRSVAAPPSVKVTGTSGRPLAGVAVTFAVGMGGGTVTGAQQVTNASGVATVGGWGVGRTTGPNTLTATVAGLTPVTFTATAVAEAPVRLVFHAQGSNGTAGTPLTPATEVWILDQFDNLVTSSTATVAIALGDNPTGATLGGTTSVAAVGGVARFESVTIDKAGEGYTLVATAEGLGSVTSVQFAVFPTSPTFGVRARR